MTSLDIGLARLRSAAGHLSAGWEWFGRWLKSLMPTGLYARSLIIIVAPMIILQGIVTAVFFDRHYRIVTATMTRGVANDVGYMVTLENRLPMGPERDRERRAAAQAFGYPAEFLTGQHLTRVISTPTTVLDRQLAFIFSTELSQAATDAINKIKQ